MGVNADGSQLQNFGTLNCREIRVCPTLQPTQRSAESSRNSGSTAMAQEHIAAGDRAFVDEDFDAAVKHYTQARFLQPRCWLGA